MRGARFALAAACLVALAGCRVDLGLDVTVDAEGAGSLALRVAPDGELVALATDAGVDPIAQLAAAVDELDGWTVEGPTGDPPVLVLTAGFDDPEELAELSAGLAEAFTAPEATLLEPLALTVTEEELALSGGAALVPGEALVEYGVEPAEAVARLGDTIAFTVTATFPGAGPHDRRRPDRAALGGADRGALGGPGRHPHPAQRDRAASADDRPAAGRRRRRPALSSQRSWFSSSAAP